MDFNLREIDVNLSQFAGKTHCAQKNNSEKLCVPCDLKSDLSITVCSWLSFWKQVSSLIVGRLAATAC